jgi:hypothetical protein
MAQVFAVTPIQHGVGVVDGESKVVVFDVGDELTEETFTEDELRAFIEGGSAVEVGTDRKYSEPPNPTTDPGAADQATRKRDQLIAASLSGDPAPGDQPAAADAVSSGASNADEPGKSIGQTAADEAKATAGGEGGSEGQP